MSRTPSFYDSEREYEDYEEREFSRIKTIRERMLRDKFIK